MFPQYISGDVVLAWRLVFILKKNDVVILTHPQTKRLLIKRIQEKRGNTYFVIGDNENHSTDSRHFGWVARRHIIGKVV